MKICEQCQGPIENRLTHAKFCGPNCRQKAYRERFKEREELERLYRLGLLED